MILVSILLALGYLAAVGSVVGLVREAKRYRAAQWLDHVIEHNTSDWFLNRLHGPEYWRD